MTAVAVGADEAGAARAERFGHPAGLTVLASTELFERISFHGMQSLLTLYMAERLFKPGVIEGVWGFAGFRRGLEALTGPMSPQALAAQIFGLYVGLVYLAPLLGGALGDRWLGRRASVVAGGLLMTAGHFAMAFDASFLIALLLLILGAGLLRGNLMPQVDTLYSAQDHRRATAFQVYYAMVNGGAFIAPLLTGALSAGFGWHFGFGFAGFGMLLGLAIYLAGGRTLPRDVRRAAAAHRPRLLAGERRRLVGLFALSPVMVLFYVAQSQVWNVYNLWVRDHVAMRVGGFDVPIPWLQSLDGLAPLACLPPMLAFWRWQAARGREPSDLAKVAMGCAIFAAGMVWLAVADVMAGATRMSIAWPVGFHLLSNLGWLYFVPTMGALFVQRAPPAMRGVMFGVFSAAIFISSLVSGRMGGLYEALSPQAFWALHAAVVGAGALYVLAFRGWLAPALAAPALDADAPALDADVRPAPPTSAAG